MCETYHTCPVCLVHGDLYFNENDNENEDQYLIADKLFACC